MFGGVGRAILVCTKGISKLLKIMVSSFIVQCFLRYYYRDVHIECVWWMVLPKVYLVLMVLLVLHMLLRPLVCVLLHVCPEKVLCMVCDSDTICCQE